MAGPASAHVNFFDQDDDHCTYPSYRYFYISGFDSGVHSDGGAPVYGECHWWFQAICATCDLVHAAHWYMPISGANNGLYRVETWIANDDHCTSQNARYRRFRDGTAGGVTEQYPINQLGNQNKWKCVTCDDSDTSDLFYGSDGAYMQLVDRSNDGQSRLCADAMFFEAIH